MSAIAYSSKPLQSNAVGVGFVLLSGLGAWYLFGATYTALLWAGFFVVLVALFAFEKLSRSPA